MSKERICSQLQEMLSPRCVQLRAQEVSIFREFQAFFTDLSGHRTISEDSRPSAARS